MRHVLDALLADIGLSANFTDGLVRAYDPDQPRDEIGRWTDGGGAVPLDQDAYDDPRYQDIIGGLYSPNEWDVRRTISALKKRGQWNKDGTASFYHVTMKDNVDSILQNGLIPGAKPAPGQSWKAEHSSYATYFHQIKDVAERDVEESGGGMVVIEARIPITEQTLARFVPDEDWSTDIQEGVKTVQEGGAVAFIGGVPPEALRVLGR